MIGSSAYRVWRIVRPGLILITILITILLGPALAEPISGNDVRVVDGDTIEHNTTVYRLIGYDTPETGPRAQCQAERMLANLAKQRLVEIIASDELDLTRVTCNCRPNTEGTRWCNYGRMCGTLTASSRYFPTTPATNVSETLINEGLALAYQCVGTSCPTRKAWCK